MGYSNAKKETIIFEKKESLLSGQRRESIHQLFGYVKRDGLKGHTQTENHKDINFVLNHTIPGLLR